MDITRYVEIQAILTKDKVLIPIWDERIVFEKTEMYGNVITIKGDNHSHYNVVSAVLDLKTKKLSMGIELDYYPNMEETEFKKDQQVLFEVGNRKLEKTIISDIIFEDFDVTIIKGKKMDSWYIKALNNVEIDPNVIYAIKSWKPTYVLKNGKKTNYTYQLYHLTK